MLFDILLYQKDYPMSYKSKVIPVDSLVTICSHHFRFSLDS